MKTYEISRDEIKGLEPMSEGYKAIKYDGGTKQDFKYCEKGENLIGRIFKVDGDISTCAWGLHFSKDPADVFNFYEPFGYNRYFKVRAYEKVIDCLDGLKSVAQCIEFCEEYDVLDYIELIKMFDRSTNAASDSNTVIYSDAVSGSSAVVCSDAVSCSNAVSCSDAVSGSYGLRECEAIKFGIFCYKKEGAKYVAFNKKITKNRFEEIYQRIRGFGFYPHFDNFYDLRGDKEWRTIAFPELVGVDNKTAWSKMPKEMRDYIESLPEYDEKIFNAIIG